MLLSCFQYLHKHKIFSGFLVLAYSLAIVFLHGTFVKISVVVMNNYSLPVYNVLVRNVFGGLGLLLFLLLLFKSIKSELRFLLLLYLFSVSVLIALHAAFLFEMNIEIIHAIEYALLALLVYSLTGKYGAAIIFCIPVMLIDEWRQYLVLYPGYTQYFEFNDIVMDILGCGFAMLALKILCVEIRAKSTNVFFTRAEFIFLVLLVISFFALLKTCVFSLHIKSSCSNTIIPLSLLENPDSFWQVHSFTKARYHVLSPVNGIVAITFLCLFFMGLDGYSSSAKTSPSKMV
jgi:hypothetical protein